MTNLNINYSAVLADLEARKEELESAISAVKTILAAGGISVAGHSEGVYSPENIPVGSFLRLSIPEATKKFLDMVKTKQGVPQITKALERGGLPRSKQNTIYSVLRRRESIVGDIIRVDDEWALAEWYPNNPNLRKRAEKESNGKTKKATTATKRDKKTKNKKPVKATSTPISVPPPVTSTPPKSQKLSTPDAAEQVLIKANGALDLKNITEQINSDFGVKIPVGLLKSLLGRDTKKRFKNVENGSWDLVNRAGK
jgi:hypothetical protein